MPTRYIKSFVITLGLVLAPNVSAFWSFCFNVHGDITNSALSELGASPCAITAVINANRGQDQFEGQGALNTQPSCSPLSLTYSPNIRYQAIHHFDRPVSLAPSGACNTSNSTVFTSSHSYLVAERDEVLNYMAKGDTPHALAALGRALHALQDFFAHSNYVDLEYGLAGNPGDAQLALSALLSTSSTEPPCSLVFTSYDPVASPINPEQPPDPLNYTHGSFAKDGAFKNDESEIIVASGITKFAAAESAASDASYQFVHSIPDIGGVLNLDGAACNVVTHAGQIIENGDPNDKSGPQGVGAAQWLAAQSSIPYAMFFTNESSATAPVQQVRITDAIDSTSFDLSRSSLGVIGVPGGLAIPPKTPLGQNAYSGMIDLRPAEDLLVKATVSLDINSGVITWVLSSIDPATGQPPSNPLIGFLPPGAEGTVVLNLTPKDTISTGAIVKNQAVITFDANAPINTGVWANTIDNMRPTSSVAVLPASEATTNFFVQWSGADVGAGVQDYTIYVSDNGAPYMEWLSNTKLTQSIYTGVGGHTYSFYSIARDLVGNIETKKTSGDTSTQVIIDTTPPIIIPQVSGTIGNNGWYRSDVTVTWHVIDPESGIVSSNGCDPKSLSNETTGVTVTCSAINGANLSNVASLVIKIDKTPPVISGMPLAGCVLWPPNHKLVQVATVNAADRLSGLALGSFQVNGISDEPTNDPANQEILISPNGSGGYVVQLQADRLGTGTGREYTLTASASDVAGNAAIVTAICSVPHDQGAPVN